VLSPCIFGICFSALLKIISHCCEGVDLGEGRSANTAAFADDTALVTHTTNSVQAILDGPLKAFCDWTSMEINTDKTYITGINFENEKEICTRSLSDVTGEGDLLKAYPQGTPSSTSECISGWTDNGARKNTTL